MMRRSLWIGLGVAAVTAWSLVASVIAWMIYMWTLSFPIDAPLAWFAWWRMLPWWNVDRWAQLAVGLGGVLASMLAIFTAVLAWPLLRRRADAPLYGRTEWATPAEMDRRGLGRTSRL